MINIGKSFTKGTNAKLGSGYENTPSAVKG